MERGGRKINFFDLSISFLFRCIKIWRSSSSFRFSDGRDWVFQTSPEHDGVDVFLKDWPAWGITSDCISILILRRALNSRSFLFFRLLCIWHLVSTKSFVGRLFLGTWYRWTLTIYSWHSVYCTTSIRWNNFVANRSNIEFKTKKYGGRSNTDGKNWEKLRFKRKQLKREYLSSKELKTHQLVFRFVSRGNE